MCNPQREDLEKLRIAKWTIEQMKKNLEKSIKHRNNRSKNKKQ